MYLDIDIETYASVSLSKCGVYKYAESDDFEILLFGCSVDGGPVFTVDLACGETMPGWIVDALVDEGTVKWAFNAQFERICLSRYLRDKGIISRGAYLEPSSWRCTMVWSAYLGLPLSLAGVGSVLRLEKQKLSEGRDLIRYFSMPCAPTKTNGGRTRNLPEHDPDRWQRYKAYNIRDVETELLIQERLSKFPVPDQIWEEYHLDQRINDRGIRIDPRLVDNALMIEKASHDILESRMREITGIENPNSVMQMKQWLNGMGIETGSLDKKTMRGLIGRTDGRVREAVEIRTKLSRSSVRKYSAIRNAVCADGRCRGMFQFYGASRTGRFAGRLVQLQNLPQNHMEDLAEARCLVHDGNMEAIRMLYDDIPDTLSQLIRTAFIPSEGAKFFVADFSAIEARVIAWYAEESWRTQIFADGGDIYCASASQMFGVPVERHGINSHLRQKGKIAELALGYGGSVGALKSMGALEMGIEEEELPELVAAWRRANPNIVRLWRDVGNAVIRAVKTKSMQTTHGICVNCTSGMLMIRLPSGRTLFYVKPRMGSNRFGGESVLYEGAGASKKWELIESYGPKFVENIVQATSRDILMYAMCTLSDMDIVAHVHDEVIIEADPSMSIESVCERMGRVPSWAEGLVLRADGYICDFYMKD